MAFISAKDYEKLKKENGGKDLTTSQINAFVSYNSLSKSEKAAKQKEFETFLSDYQSAYNNAIQAYNGRINSGSDFKNTKEDIIARNEALRQMSYYENKAKDFEYFLGGQDIGARGVMNAVAKESDYWNQFKTQEDFDNYNKAVADAKEYDRISKLNKKQLQERKNQLEAENEQLKNSGTRIWNGDIYNPSFSTITDNEAKLKKNQEEIDAISADLYAYNQLVQEKKDEWRKQYLSTLNLDEANAELASIPDKITSLTNEMRKLSMTGDHEGASQIEQQLYQLRDRNEQLTTDVREASAIQKYNSYMELQKVPDFKAFSNVATDDANYNAINSDLNKAVENDIIYDNRSKEAVNRRKLSYLSNEEKAVYNYLFAKEGQQAAEDFLASTEYKLAERNMEKTIEANSAFATSSAPAAALASAGTVVNGIVNGAAYFGQAADLFSDGYIDNNAGYNVVTKTNSAIRGAIDEDIKRYWVSKGKTGQWASFAYQTGMSMADFLFQAAVGGSLFGGGTKAAEKFTLAIMGTGAAASGTLEALDRGLSSSRAFTLGTIAGAAEIISEKVSIEALFDEAALNTDGLKYVLQNFLFEGAEEVESDIINGIADLIVSKDKSQWSMAIAQYMAQGMSEQAAFIQAMKDQAMELGMDFLSGAVSGGIMGVGGVIGNNIRNTSVGKDLAAIGRDEKGKRQYTNLEALANSLIEDAKSMGADTESGKVAADIEAKRAAGKKISMQDIGRLFESTTNAKSQALDMDENEYRKQYQAEIAQRRFENVAAAELVNEGKIKVEEATRGKAVEKGVEAYVADTADERYRNARKGKAKEHYFLGTIDDGKEVVSFSDMRSIEWDQEHGLMFEVEHDDGTKSDVPLTSFNTGEDIGDAFELARKVCEGSDITDASVLSDVARTAIAARMAGNITSDQLLPGFLSIYGAARRGTGYLEALTASVGDTARASVNRMTDEQKQLAFRAGDNAGRIMSAKDGSRNMGKGLAVRVTGRITKVMSQKINAVNDFLSGLGRHGEIYDNINIEELRKNGKISQSAQVSVWQDPSSKRINAAYIKNADGSVEYIFAANSIDTSFMFVAVHESLHDIRANLKSVNGLSGEQVYQKMLSLVSEFYKKQGVYNDMLSHQLSLLGVKDKNDIKAIMYDHANNSLLDAAQEEVVANALPAILANQSTMEQFALMVAEADGASRHAFERFIYNVKKFLAEALEILSKGNHAKSWGMLKGIANNQKLVNQLYALYEDAFTRLAKQNAAPSQMAGQEFTQAQATDIAMDDVEEVRNMPQKFSTADAETDSEYMELAKDLEAGKDTLWNSVELAEMLESAAEKAGAYKGSYGQVQMFHHGTDADFNTFRSGRNANGKNWGMGHYLTPTQSVAEDYAKGKRVVSVFVFAQKFATHDDHSISKSGKAAFTSMAANVVQELGITLDQLYDADAMRNQYREEYREQWDRLDKRLQNEKAMEQDVESRIAHNINEWVSQNIKMQTSYNSDDASILREASSDIADALKAAGVSFDMDAYLHAFSESVSNAYGYQGIAPNGTDIGNKEIVIWDNRLIKEANLIEHDDAGNIIPLSQRFNTQNPDIRFSYATFAEPDIKPGLTKAKATKTLGMSPEDITMVANTTNGKKDVVYASGRSVLEAVMKKYAKDNHMSSSMQKATLRFMDRIGKWMNDVAVAEYHYIGLQDLNNAKMKIDWRNGKKVVLSARVKNGEYDVNFDLSKICKKRVAFSNFIDDLATRPGKNGKATMLDEIDLSPENIFKMNQILKDMGYETACLGCFVESRRYGIKTWAETIVNEWNARVDQIDPNAGYFDFAGGSTSADIDTISAKEIRDIDNYMKDFKQRVKDVGADVASEENKAKIAALEEEKKQRKAEISASKTMSKDEKKVARNQIDAEYNPQIAELKMNAQAKMLPLMQSDPRMLKKLRVGDLISSQGRTALHEYSAELESIVASRFGTSSPKSVEAFAPYNSEIALLPDTKSIGRGDNKVTMSMGEYLSSIAGARSQSFSDFIISQVFDHLQKTADLAARGFKAHTYTKEIARAMLFGMTGEKINMSVMFDINPDADWQYAGLEGNSMDSDYSVADYKHAAAVEGKTGEKQFTYSIPFAKAVEIEHNPLYSKDCGIIGVGHSYFGMLKMFRDERIPYIIGYHRSGMPEAIMKATHIELSADYTSVQNTLKFGSGVQFRVVNNAGDYQVPSYATWGGSAKKDVKASDLTFDLKQALADNGGDGRAAMQAFLDFMQDNSLTPNVSKAVPGHGSFDLYGDLENTMDPNKTANNYIAWCINNNMVPMFYEFAAEPEYSKILFDFSVRDLANNGACSPQRAVSMDGLIALGEDAWESIASRFMKQYDDYMKEQFFGDKYEETLNQIYDSIMSEDLKHADQKFSVADVSLFDAYESGSVVKANDVFGEFYRLNSNAESETLARKVFDACRRLNIVYTVHETEINNFNSANVKDTTKISAKAAGVTRGSRVRFNKEFFADPGYDKQSKADVILHESIHAVTSFAIDLFESSDGVGTTKVSKPDPEGGYTSSYLANRNITDEGVIKRIKSVYNVDVNSDEFTALADFYDTIAAAYDAMDLSFEAHGEYGMTNKKEFIAELANDEFRKKLKGKGFLQELLDAFLRLIGVSKEGDYSVYSVTYDALEKFLSMDMSKISERRDMYMQYQYMQTYGQKFSIVDSDLTDEMRAEINPNAVTALFIRNTAAQYVDKILSGEKTEETRTHLRYLGNDGHMHTFVGGEIVGIVNDDGMLVAYAKVTGINEYKNSEEFHTKEANARHMVPEGSEYDIKGNGKKYGLVLDVINTLSVPIPTRNDAPMGTRKLTVYSVEQAISEKMQQAKATERVFVDYNDNAKKEELVNKMHNALMESDTFVTLNSAFEQVIDKYFPDLSKLKRRERKERSKALKHKIAGVLTETVKKDIISDGGDKFRVTLDAAGTIYIARATGNLTTHMLGRKISNLKPDQARMLFNTREILKNGTYVYSALHDPHSNDGKNIIDWDYFYTAIVTSKGSEVGLLFAVRNMDAVVPKDEHQIYAFDYKLDKEDKKIAAPAVPLLLDQTTTSDNGVTPLAAKGNIPSSEHSVKFSVADTDDTRSVRDAIRENEKTLKLLAKLNGGDDSPIIRSEKLSRRQMNAIARELCERYGSSAKYKEVADILYEAFGPIFDPSVEVDSMQLLSDAAAQIVDNVFAEGSGAAKLDEMLSYLNGIGPVMLSSAETQEIKSSFGTFNAFKSYLRKLGVKMQFRVYNAKEAGSAYMSDSFFADLANSEVGYLFPYEYDGSQVMSLIGELDKLNDHKLVNVYGKGMETRENAIMEIVDELIARSAEYRSEAMSERISRQAGDVMSKEEEKRVGALAKQLSETAQEVRAQMERYQAEQKALNARTAEMVYEAYQEDVLDYEEQIRVLNEQLKEIRSLDEKRRNAQRKTEQALSEVKSKLMSARDHLKARASSLAQMDAYYARELAVNVDAQAQMARAEARKEMAAKYKAQIEKLRNDKKLQAKDLSETMTAYNKVLADVTRQAKKDVRTARKEGRLQRSAEVLERDLRRNYRARIAARTKTMLKMLNGTANVVVPEGARNTIGQFVDIMSQQNKKFDKDQLRLFAQFYRDMGKGTIIGDEAQDLQNMFDEDIADRFDQLIDIIGGKRISELTSDELRQTLDITNVFYHIARHADDVRRRGRSESMKKDAMSLFRQLNAEADRKDHGQLYNNVEGFLVNNQTPYYFFKQAGGVLEKYYQDIDNGVRQYTLNVQESQKRIQEIKDQFNYDEWSMDTEENRIQFEAATHRQVSLTRGEAMLIWATNKREQINAAQKADHLRGGGIVLQEDRKNGKNKALTAVANRLTDENLQYIDNWLTPEQKACADALVQYLSADMAELGNEVTMQLYGIRKFDEPYYIPYNCAGTYLNKRVGTGAVNLDNMLKTISFTQKLTTRADAPILVDDIFNVASRHIERMTMYNALCIPLDNMNRLMNYKTRERIAVDENGRPIDVPLDGDGNPIPLYNEDGTINADVIDIHYDENGNPLTKSVVGDSIRTMLTAKRGTNAVKYIDQFIDDMNGGANTDPRESFGSRMLSMFKKNAVMMSMSVAIQQPSAIGRAFALVDPKYFAQGMASKGSYEELKKYSYTAVLKEIGGFDTGTGRGIADWINGGYEAPTKTKQVLNKIDEVGGYLPGKMDELTWGVIWRAIKLETEAKNPDLHGEDLLQAAGARFDEVINATQVYDSTISRSSNMRSKTWYMKAATAFMAEPTVGYNLLVDAVTQAKKGNAKYAGRAIASFAVAAIINSLLKSLVTAARKQDDDETYGEKYLAEVTGNMFSELNPFGLVPIAKDVISIFDGYTVSRSDMDAIQDIKDAYDTLMNDNKSAMDKINAMAAAVSITTGVPVRNVLRDSEAVYNVISNGIKMAGKGSSQGTRLAMEEALSDVWPFSMWVKSSNKDYAARIIKDYKAGDIEAVEATIRDYQFKLDRQGKSAEDIGKKTESWIKKAVKEAYDAKEIDYDTAFKLLTEIGEIAEKVAFKTLQAVDYDDTEYGDSSSAYVGVYDAIDNGGDVEAAIGKMVKSGYEEKTVRQQAVYGILELYKGKVEGKAKISDAQARTMLTKYGKLSSDDAAKKIKEANVFLTYGVEYSSNYSKLKEALKAGTLSKEQAIKILMNVRGYTRDKAKGIVDKW